MKYELQSTEQFDKWFSRLKDSSVRIKILARLNRIENGNFGDFKQIGQDLFELRFFSGPGIRIYYTLKAKTIVILLAGGKKSTQSKDIETATAILKALED
ncbi:type II toxin-antitoxin system RelE/ParE family toxin [Desulfosarcina cetonica]|uniref:type II toxin-antitoxin system RelE/ParE family toxin n=1 Tax=Desulfosarcina cetonica TaxID=90730 RepID=UPI0006D153AF|nr:type II toxin-antitoxin system RelE/ParE family toxin [Desulfosarcina cetonica]